MGPIRCWPAPHPFLGIAQVEQQLRWRSMSMDVCGIGFRRPASFLDSWPARSSRACEARSSQWLCSRCMRVEAKGYIDLWVNSVCRTVEMDLRPGCETWARDGFEESLYAKMMESGLFKSVLRNLELTKNRTPRKLHKLHKHMPYLMRVSDVWELHVSVRLTGGCALKSQAKECI